MFRYVGKDKLYRDLNSAAFIAKIRRKQCRFEWLFFAPHIRFEGLPFWEHNVDFHGSCKYMKDFLKWSLCIVYIVYITFSQRVETR